MLENLYLGARLALLRPPHGRVFNDTLPQILILMFLGWILAMLADLIDAGTPATLSRWGVVSYAAFSYLSLFVIASVAVLAHRPRVFAPLATGVFAADAFLWLVWIASYYGLQHFAENGSDQSRQIIWWAFLTWQCLIMLVLLIRFLGVSRLRAYILSVSYGGLLFALQTVLPDEPFFRRLQDVDFGNAIDIEQTYYAQHGLLNRALNKLTAERRGEVDLYFVGFAGYAHEDVFLHEVSQAQAIVAKRLAGSGRTLAMINNPATVDTVPLANRHNLERTLKTIGKMMNGDEDILMLLLSSHGSADASLEVSFDEFQLNDLNANELRAALDAAQIEWRIVVVSACFAGSFIDALRTPKTLIITAAAADRSSFGCSHKRQWTYFGEAFFADALTQTTSLSAAFEIARERIAKRESLEKKEPSLPQIEVGDAIAAHLQRLATPARKSP